MATYLELDQPTDPRLSDYLRLRDTQLRHSVEATEGLYIAEGTTIIRRAIEAGHRPRSVLLAPRWIDGLRDLVDPLDVDVFVVSEAMAEQVTGFHVHRGALASMQRPAPRSLDDLAGCDRLVIVEDLVDHANLGAIARSVAALGWDGLIVSSRSADPLYRRAVKASMGTVLSLPWVRSDEDLATLATLKRAGFVLVATALADEAVPVDEARKRVTGKRVAGERVAGERVVLMLGTEGHGLSQSWLDHADVVVTIPMAAGVDSLNVGAAAAICLWELRP